MSPLTYIKLGAGIAALLAILFLGYKVKSAFEDAARVPELVQQLKDVQAEAVEKAAQAQRSLELEYDLQNKLADSRGRADTLARRLRDYFKALPDPAASPTDPAGTSGSGSGPSDVTDAFRDAISACERDSIRLNGWLEYYQSVPSALKPPTLPPTHPLG
jgi:hypothetical protein